MQTQASLKQLELSMWQVLKTAKSEPLAANLQQLWHNLEQVIELTDKNQKLRVLGDAITSLSFANAFIVEIYVMRANAILSTLEAPDSSGGEPILSEDFLNDLMRQSMSIDLSDMMKLLPEPEPKPRSSVPARGTIVAPLDDLEANCAIASAVPDDPKQMLVKLAGNEQVSQWSGAIADWMQQHSGGEIVSLVQLQQALGMPLVEIWLGLLLSSQHQYDWETRGDYSNAHSIRLYRLNYA